jgi:MinD superfamily P-loop ATPase
MNISRKEFFRKSIYSLGEAVCSVSEALRSPADATVTVADLQDFVPAERDDLVAAAHNDTCLARSCGCFSCVERCELRAIKLVPGVGVRINPQLCTGCGTCEYVCPVTPKAVRLQTRTAPQSSSAHPAEIPPSKGETPC